MARHIAYDPDKVKQSITTLFWAKGYSDTSLADLEKATGLNRRQLYNGIGDKLEMFLVALDDFTRLSAQTLLAPLESSEAGVADIKTLFSKFVDMSQASTGPKGCLVCSSSQDEIAMVPEVSFRINSFLDRIREAHFNALTQACRRGEISLSETECEKRADALLGTHVALCILGRASRPSHQLRQIAVQALGDLE